MRRVTLDSILKASIVLLLAAFVWVLYGSIHQRVIEQGDTAPNFTITADNGRTISASNFGGRLLVLNFWATWCAPCVEEVPSLNQFARDMAGSGVVVLGVSVDQNEKTYRNFLQRAHISFMTARDPHAKISSDYGTFKYPESYVINSQGKVVLKVVGQANWTDPDMMRYVKTLL
jgi:cytochrome c biogenesis protein CcmG, thiol:disulfide interchange protein DsbE